MSKFHVLLIEDSEMDEEIVVLALSEVKPKTRLTVKKDGSEALTYLSETKDFPNLILLDWNIPKVSGIKLLDFLKNGELKKIPVVVFTTSKRGEDIDNAYERYCNAYSVKPIDMEDTIRRIKEIVLFFCQTAEQPIF
jgi:CheY-like chemotaxis protein